MLCENVVIEALFLSLCFIWTCSVVILAWFMHIELLFLSCFFLFSILTIYIYIYTILLASCSRFACNWCVLFKMQRRERWRAYFIYLGCALTSFSLFLMWQKRSYTGLVFFICCIHTYIQILFVDRYIYIYIYRYISRYNIDWFAKSVLWSN
jgi:hypothetical protein